MARKLRSSSSMRMRCIKSNSLSKKLTALPNFPLTSKPKEVNLKEDFLVEVRKFHDGTENHTRYELHRSDVYPSSISGDFQAFQSGLLGLPACGIRELGTGLQSSRRRPRALLRALNEALS